MLDIDGFISLIAHEFRTPLTIIKGYTDLLETGDLGKLTSQQREGVREIITANERLVNLVDGMLNVGRIKQKTLALKPTACDLSAIIFKVIEQVDKNEHRNNNGKIEYNAAHTIGATKIDTEAFRFIVTHLIRNAVQYSIPGAAVDVLVSQKKDGIKIEVCNQPMDWSQELVRLVGQPLYRTPEAANKNPEGAGLGLYTCFLLAAYARSNLKITASSQTFHAIFTIPKSGMRRHAGTKQLTI